MDLEEILNGRQKLHLLVARSHRNVYDEGDGGEGGDGHHGEGDGGGSEGHAGEGHGGEGGGETAAAHPAVKVKARPKVAFTAEQQGYINSLLAEERRKAKTGVDKLITQLETEKNRATTTAAEKEALEQRIEELKNSQLTAEELRKKDDKKRQDKWEKDLKEANQRAEHWEKLFTTTTIQREITQAAVSAKAYNPRHVVNELATATRLVPELDEDNKPTGQLIPRVKVTTVKDGKPVPMEMTVTEAVKWMSEQDEHAPLFNSGATGGLGAGPNNPRRSGSDPDEPPTDPREYVEWRKKHRSFSGAPKR